jgi:predicted acylesterase/phospholipase RssA
MSVSSQPASDAESRVEESAGIPRHPPHECDLVMKGGITSGLVYPAAVLQLAKKYRFRNIGGTSVGAIAAAVVAAAELGRQSGEGSGFTELQLMNDEFTQPGYVLKLFQPQKGSQAAFELLIASTDTSASTIGRIRGIVSVLIRRARTVIVPALLLWLASLVLLGVALGEKWWILPLAVAGWGIVAGVVLWARTRRPIALIVGLGIGVVLALAWPVLLGAGVIGASLYESLNHEGFGMCLGTSQGSEPALTEWLHQHIQNCVGRDTDEPSEGDGEKSRPVTFGDLAAYGIDLQVMTTNLSTTRPVRLPAESEDYLFRESDVAGLYPPRVVRHLKRHARPIQDPELASAGFFRMPLAKDLPVLVGFRMSLSFPILFTGVCLHSLHPIETDKVIPNWFSDGGASSNFPIHFFDSWLPSRPTFGLSLGPYPQGADGRTLPGEGDIGEPAPPTSYPVPNWINVTKIGSFLHQILDTMENWRDTMQSELPGFQDRVYQVRLTGKQGGLNLNMSPTSIVDLIDKGRQAGTAINERFNWEQHFLTRYVTTMQMIQIGLIGEDDPATGANRRGVLQNFAPLRQAFEDGYPGDVFRFGHDAAWCKEAGSGTWKMAEGAGRWRRLATGTDPGFTGFNSGSEPRPKPAMRIVPRV